MGMSEYSSATGSKIDFSYILLFSILFLQKLERLFSTNINVQVLCFLSELTSHDLRNDGSSDIGSSREKRAVSVVL